MAPHSKCLKRTWKTNITFLLKYTQPSPRMRKHEHLINEYIIKEWEQSHKYHLVNIKTRHWKVHIPENLFLLSIRSSVVLIDPLKLSGLINSIYLFKNLQLFLHRPISPFSYEFQNEDHILNQRQSYLRKVMEEIQ